MVLYILGYKQPHAAPPGAPRITRSRASPCPPAAPPDPAAAYILGYMNGFLPGGLSRRPNSAAPVTPLAPKPRTLSQRSRYDVPVLPAARTPPPPSRRPRQSLALCPSVRVTTSRLAPPFASRRSRHATHAKASHSVPAFASRHPGSSRRPNSAAPVTPSAPRRLAPPRALRTGRPPAPHLIEATRVSCDLRPLETLAFLCCGTELGALPQTPAGAQGSVSPVGCWAEGPKRPEAGQRNHERDRQGSAND